MTNYIINASFTVSEAKAIEAALEEYEKICNEKGSVAPYLAHKMSIPKIRLKLHQNWEMISTNNFNDP